MPAEASGSFITRSMLHRNAAKVFPDPVGARIRLCPPSAMAFHPCSWAGVGARKLLSNQARVGSENRPSAMAGTLPAA